MRYSPPNEHVHVERAHCTPRDRISRTCRATAIEYDLQIKHANATLRSVRLLGVTPPRQVCLPSLAPLPLQLHVVSAT